MPPNTTRPRVTKSGEDRRRDIMDAAVEVFGRKGISASTVAEITDAAGVAKGTFYLYFDSKDHVVAALRERFVQELTAHAMPFVERIGVTDWWDLADTVAEDMVDWTLQHRDICVVIMQAPYTPDTHDTLVEGDARLTAFIAAGIRAGMAAGAFDTPDPALAGEVMYYGMVYSVLHRIMEGRDIDRDALVAAAKGLVRKILAPPS